jgi:hypothetical protein
LFKIRRIWVFSISISLIIPETPFPMLMEIEVALFVAYILHEYSNLLDLHLAVFTFTRIFPEDMFMEGEF